MTLSEHKALPCPDIASYWFKRHYELLGFEKIELVFRPAKGRLKGIYGDYEGYRNGKKLLIELEAYSSALFLHSLDALEKFDVMICYHVFKQTLER